MLKVRRVELAWLAGFWDGEGSIGIVKNKATKILNAQMSHTDRLTMVRTLCLLRDMEIAGRGYTYQERDPMKHRDAHYLRISGMANVLKLAKLLLPYAITKRRHWEIAIDFAERRIKFAGGLDSKGHLRRGGIQQNKGYSTNENALFEELKKLNRRGPKGRTPEARGRIAI